MSRLKVLKEIKNKIKVVTCGLALTLAIGSTQGSYTYALFTDTENLSSKLSISTGDVDVKVKVRKVQTINGRDQKIKFSIKNEGTLNQNISIKVQPQNQLRGHLSNSSIYFNSTTNYNTPKNTNVGFNDYTTLQKSSGGLFVLSTGQTIEGYIYLKISEHIPNDKSYNLDLLVKATQINKSNELQNNGFYDEEILQNIINIKKVKDIENVDQSSKEDIPKIESELVEQPNLEEELPNEPEIIEPPKVEEEIIQGEQDIVDKPNTEEEIAPSKPNKEIQLMLPNNTDTIVEQKEESDIEE